MTMKIHGVVTTFDTPYINRCESCYNREQASKKVTAGKLSSQNSTGHDVRRRRIHDLKIWGGASFKVLCIYRSVAE